MILQNSTDIKTEIFYDENGDVSPIDVEYEKHIINPNGLIQLRNIPSALHTVFTVTRRDGVNAIKYDKTEIIANQYDFTVDYINGILTFDSSQVGKEIQVSYTNSIGRLLISADRIFTNLDSQGSVIQRLSTLLEEGEETLSRLDTVGGATNIINEMKGYIDSIKSLTPAIIEGSNISSGLQNDIRNAKLEKINLTKEINEAGNKLDEINEWVEGHGDIVDLDNRVDTVSASLEQNKNKIDVNTFILPSTKLDFKGSIINNKPYPYMCWVFGTGFYDESIDEIGLFINGKTSHTSTDGAIYFLQKNTIDDEYNKFIKVGENSGKGTITHAGGICPNGDYICIAKLTTNGNENIEQSVIYRSTDKGDSWNKENFNVDTLVNPIFDGYGGVFKTSDNSLLTYARELDGSNWYILKSVDNGYSWSKKTISNPLISENEIYKEVMEGNIVEMSDGVLMCVLRTRLMTNAYIKDSAILTYSYDNGESWTPLKKSNTWLDLSSNNCSMITHKENKTIEVVYGSRYSQSDGKGSLFSFVVSEENAKNDNFPVATRIFKGEIDGDFGYPSLVQDNKNVVNLFFYNKDDNGTNIYFAKGCYNGTLLEKKELTIKKDIHNKSVIADSYFLREYVDLTTIKHDLPLRHLYYLKNSNVKNIYDSTTTTPEAEIILDVPTIMGLSWLNRTQAYLVEVLFSNNNEGTEVDFNEIALVPSNGLITEVSRGRVLWNGTQLISQQIICNTNYGEGTLKLCISKPTNVKLLKIKLLGFYII